MSNRREHNLSVKLMAPHIADEKVDDTNYFMDLPSQIIGPQHRKYFGHNPNPFAIDSLMVNRFDPQREFARQVHMKVDRNKQMQKMLLMMSVLNGDNMPKNPQKNMKQMLLMMMLMRM